MPLRAQRLFHSNLARSLLNRDQHDVHQADTADSQSQRADEGEQYFERSGHDRELVVVLLEVGDEHSSVIVRTKVVVASEHRPHHAGELLVSLPSTAPESTGDVL